MGISYRIARTGFRQLNGVLNRFGVLLSKPEAIHGSPAFSGAMTWARRLNYSKFFFEAIEGVEGDIVESGVHWGYGIVIELSLMDSAHPRKIYGFDSFAGHSKPHENDRRGGQYMPLDDAFKVSEEDVWKTLRMGTGLDTKTLLMTVILIHGWMQDTMPQFKKSLAEKRQRLALVHADCDVYEPFSATLNATWDALSVKGIVVVGRLNNPELQGKTTAVQEFLASIDPSTYELCTFEMVDTNGQPATQSYLRKLA